MNNAKSKPPLNWQSNNKGINNILNLYLAISAIIGFFLVSISSSGLHDSLAFSKNTLSMMYPLFFTSVYISICTFLGQMKKSRALLSVLLFFIICLPLTQYFNNEITHIFWDDGYRNSFYANNIIDSKSLWGADGKLWGIDPVHKLIHEGEKVYIDQPGYRYWLAFTMTLFHGETRGMQIFNITLVLITVLTFIVTTEKYFGKAKISKISILIALSSPYLTKNILQGMTEWLTVLLFLLFIIFFINKLYLMSTVIIAILPFIRQNLLIFSILMFFYILIKSRRIGLSLLYFTLIGLPIYHNLFYAGKFQLLVSGINYANSSQHYEGVFSNSILAIFFRSLEYIGLEFNTNILSLILAWLFVPFGTFLIINELLKLRGNKLKVLLLMICSLIVPTLLFGGVYYPRFVFVNQMISILLIYSLSFKEVNEDSNKYINIVK